MQNYEFHDSDSDSSSNSQNNEDALCKRCWFEKEQSEMITLECQHSICLLCLEEHALENLNLTINCPLEKCTGTLTDAQIRQVLPNEDVLRYETLSMSKVPNIHRCLLPECGNIIWYKKPNETYQCDKCSLFNCIQCNAAHKSFKCSKFKSLPSAQAQAKCKTEIDRARAQYRAKAGVGSEETDLVENDRVFMCNFCCLVIAKGVGVRLRSCGHCVCKPCLKAIVTTTPVIPPKCMYEECTGNLYDREIYAILSAEELAVYERKSFTRIKLKLGTAIQCQQPNCEFFCELTNPDAKVLYCSKCNSENCLKCKAIHKGESCEEYKERIKLSNLGITEAHIQKAINDGECMKCPDCQNLVKKGLGCNWIQCSNCGLELCWILKMRRWGPGGRGDVSGGCRCMEDGYCHPDCLGCIPDN